MLSVEKRSSRATQFPAPASVWPTIVFAVGICYVLVSERTIANERRIMGDGNQAQVKPSALGNTLSCQGRTEPSPMLK